MVAGTGGARTIHRSFRSREIGFGGVAGAVVPVDSRIDKAIDEGRVKAKERSRLFANPKVADKSMPTNSVKVIRRVKVVRPRRASGQQPKPAS